jgi:hypothetical protein
MKPIGLTCRDKATNPFTARTSGEIYLVHLCLGCGKLSINRISGDDLSYKIIDILNNSDNKEKDVRNIGIDFIQKKDIEIVMTALYGYNYKNS